MGKEKILVIDDDADIVSVVHDILSTEGFDVLTAESGTRGLEMLRDNTPDLIILDLKMPGMSGVGFLNEISGPDGKLKYRVLILTAYGNMSSFFKNLDIDGFLLKPMRGDDLVAEVNRIFSSRSAKPRPPPEAVVTGRKKVLIAEDDDGASNTLALVFSRAGYVTEQTNNGSDAIAIAILSIPDVLVIKAVFSAMNGSKVASILKTIPKTSHLPIVLYDQEGFANPMAEAMLRSGEISAFVPNKSAKEILESVSRVLSGR